MLLLIISQCQRWWGALLHFFIRREPVSCDCPGAHYSLTNIVKLMRAAWQRTGCLWFREDSFEISHEKLRCFNGSVDRGIVGTDQVVRHRGFCCWMIPRWRIGEQQTNKLFRIAMRTIFRDADTLYCIYKRRTFGIASQNTLFADLQIWTEDWWSEDKSYGGSNKQ